VQKPFDRPWAPSPPPVPSEPVGAAVGEEAAQAVEGQLIGGQQQPPEEPPRGQGTNAMERGGARGVGNPRVEGGKI